MATTMNAQSLPVISLADGPGRVGEQIAAACRVRGFFYIRDHGIPQATIDGAFEANRWFHALDMEQKLRLRLNRAHRGYQSLGGSKLNASARFAAARYPNQLESFFIRQALPPDHPDLLAGRPLQGENQWPDGNPDFRMAVERYESAVRDLGMRMLPAFALALDLPDAYFTPHFREPNIALRLIHYPPTPTERPDGLYGANEHTDYGFMTILVQDDIGGLQVQSADGSWTPVPSLPGTFVINIGDMLARWTNEHFQSTPHRVLNASSEKDRYSVAYFFDPGLDTLIECIPKFAGRPYREPLPPIRLVDYVSSRLDANYQDRDTAR